MADGAASGDPHLDEDRQVSTIFELAGTDRVGLLADVVLLLKVRIVWAWTLDPVSDRSSNILYA